MDNTYDDVLEYWIWLQQALGCNSAKPDKLLSYFGSVNDIYNAKRPDYLNCGFLSEKEIDRLSLKSLEKSEKIVSDCMKNGYNVLSYKNLPKRLQNIYAPPLVLYTMGEFPEPTDGVYIAMVGSRDVTAYGVEAATKLAMGLSRCGAVVVSGLAVGVDAASHNGAIKGGGKTVAVVGSGLDIDYPAKNRELKIKIAQNGAVVSEFPPGTAPTRATFPIRNRIIAGLSLGCVVVEAGTKSGALITASQAAEMGRDVFAVPGSIFSHMSDGTNKLIKDGAKPVSNVIDILEEYIGVCDSSVIEKMSHYAENRESGEQLTFDNMSSKAENSKRTEPQKTFQQKKEKPKNTAEIKAKPRAVPQGLSETQLMVYNVMTGDPMHVDDISLKANLELRMVLASLTTLEIEGYVRSYPGKRYSVIG